MKKLTAIIPFLNEGIEIENTLHSIRTTVGNSIDILLINDCSTDEFDYAACALRHNAQYHKNKERMGVAASRDLGVSLITTPYFLLLDGHMRFYDDKWTERIVEELEASEKVILCCQTKALYKNDYQIVSSHMQVFGAYIDLVDNGNLLDAAWNSFERDPDAMIEDIPCILGAGYACSKKYWQFLRGLWGLMYYGYDETYLSLKVWLSGGKCKLLKDVVIGHIYRDTFPYKVESAHAVYNKLLIAALLLPKAQKEVVFLQQKVHMGEAFIWADNALKEKEAEIYELKQYYKSIFSVNFDFIYSWNVEVKQKQDSLTLKIIADHLMQNRNKTEDVGLLYGKMGIVIFFAHYARYTNQRRYEEFSEILLEEIYDSIVQKTSIDFQSGLCGIGWGIEYLVQNGLMEGDTNEILEDIDEIVMDLNIENRENLSLDNGLGGVLHYVYARMISAFKNNREIPFRQNFLNQLSEKASFALLDKTQETEYSETVSRFLCLINRNNLESKESIKLSQVTTLPDYFDSKFEKQPLGLRFGYAGVGIKKMRVT